MNRRGHIVLLASVILMAAILIVVSSLAFHSLCNRSIGGDYSHRWSNVGTVVSIDREAQSFVMTVGEGSAEVLPFDSVTVLYANANRFKAQIGRYVDLDQIEEGDEVEVLFFPPFDAEIEVEEVYEVNKRAEDADK